MLSLDTLRSHLRRITLVTATTALVIVVASILVPRMRPWPPTVDVVTYQHGEAKAIPNEAPVRDQLVLQTEETIAAATDALYDVIDARNIDELRKQSDAIEVTYPKLRRIELRVNIGRTTFVEFDRVMVVVAGPKAGYVVLGVGVYSSGPLLVRDQLVLTTLEKLITAVPRSQ